MFRAGGRRFESQYPLTWPGTQDRSPETGAWAGYQDHSGPNSLAADQRGRVDQTCSRSSTRAGPATLP